MKAKLQPGPVIFNFERTPEGEEIYRAAPPTVKLERGQTVTFLHHGKLGVTVFIPLPEIFEERGHVHAMQRTDHGLELMLHVRSDAPVVKGEFDYAVFSHDLKKLAVGNSPPRMILDEVGAGDRGGP